MCEAEYLRQEKMRNDTKDKTKTEVIKCIS